jgi:hypothetical protein
LGYREEHGSHFWWVKFCRGLSVIIYSLLVDYYQIVLGRNPTREGSAKAETAASYVKTCDLLKTRYKVAFWPDPDDLLITDQKALMYRDIILASVAHGHLVPEILAVPHESVPAVAKLIQQGKIQAVLKRSFSYGTDHFFGQGRKVSKRSGAWRGTGRIRASLGRLSGWFSPFCPSCRPWASLGLS